MIIFSNAVTHRESAGYFLAVPICKYNDRIFELRKFGKGELQYRLPESGQEFGETMSSMRVYEDSTLS